MHDTVFVIKPSNFLQKIPGNNLFMIYENVVITDAGSEGMAIGKIDEKIIFIPFVVPGDIVDVQVIKKKKRFLDGKVVRIRQKSDKRVEAHCSHFGLCGGCRWQNLRYEDQLMYKEKQVFDSIMRIGKIAGPVILPIIGSRETSYYRNKLDYTFSVHRWLTEEDQLTDHAHTDTRALGFHIPQFFDKVVDIQHCYHMKDPSNAIRNKVREYAISRNLGFYDVRIWQGFLRNLIIRSTEAGGLMVIMVFRYDDPEIALLLNFLSEQFPQITSIFYVINPKKNDTTYDLEFNLFKGEPYITEILPPFREGGKDIKFRIGPASFFQTNSIQTIQLYRVAAEFAALTPDATVYDLYTGTGTIANYIAPYVGKVIGIESVEAAIADAKTNSALNDISNTSFFAGETEKIMTVDFILEHGKPDIVITDPPRNGMHERVIQTLLEVRPEKIVYVSCNPATQARDLALLSGLYNLEKCQPVDMFPHTQHVENVALLTLRH